MNEMIFDTMNHRASSAPESSCRRQNTAEAKKSERHRRKRMELRRMKTIAKGKAYGEQSSSCSDSDACSRNKKRSQTEEDEPTKSIGCYKLARGSAARTLTCESHGHISVIGRRREMEDAVAVELGFVGRKGGKSYDFFGVYDGHGGWRVANACSEMLHNFVLESVGDCEEVVNWEKCVVEGFRRMDEEVNRNGGTSVAMTGSTAVVAVVGEDEVVLANCGDSRAVLCRGGDAVQLLKDHKPDRPDELKRIEVSGGKVINWNGQRVLGVLATSRSIGDYYLKPYVISEPEVKVINRTDADEFLILASDGLWDVISNDLACKVARRCLDGHVRRNTKFPIVEDEAETESYASEAAAILAELAMGRGSRDNISVIVVDLRGAAAGQCSCSAS